VAEQRTSQGLAALPLDLTARVYISPPLLLLSPFFCLFKTAKMSGQSITDRITAAQHSVTGSAVSKTVCKATTHEVMGPKKKHLDCKCHGILYYVAIRTAFESYVSHSLVSLGTRGSVRGSRPAKDSCSVLLVLFKQLPPATFADVQPVTSYHLCLICMEFSDSMRTVYV